MPRAIKPKTGYGRTATESPFIFDRKDSSKQTLFIDRLFLESEKLKTKEYKDGFTRTELESLLKHVSNFWFGFYWVDEKPNPPQKRVALKHLADASRKLADASRNFYHCLYELDTETQKYFEIDNLECAEQNAEKIHGKACVVMHDLKNRLSIKGMPKKAARHELLLLLINAIEAKFPGRLVKTYPHNKHSIRAQSAKYDEAIFSFVKSVVWQAYPKTSDDTLYKAIKKTVEEKFKINY